MAAVGPAGADGCAPPLTQVDLAACVGTAGVHVNRMLPEMRAAGTIELGRRRLRVLDRPRLEAMAERVMPGAFRGDIRPRASAASPWSPVSGGHTQTRRSRSATATAWTDRLQTAVRAARQPRLGHWKKLVGVAGLEPTTPCPPDRCATGLRYTPMPARGSALLALGPDARKPRTMGGGRPQGWPSPARAATGGARLEPEHQSAKCHTVRGTD